MMRSKLSPKSYYAAYFVFKMSSDASGFQNRRVDAEVRVGGTGVVKEGVVYLHGGGGGGVSRKRGDEWYEVKMGEFWTPKQDESESDCLELKLLNRIVHGRRVLSLNYVYGHPSPSVSPTLSLSVRRKFFASSNPRRRPPDLPPLHRDAHDSDSDRGSRNLSFSYSRRNNHSRSLLLFDESEP
ncbi:F-box protein PP2-B10 [Linum perenne]